MQETASVLWQKFPDFRPGSNFLAWALSVARYQAMYFCQKSKRDVLRFSEEFIDAVSAETVAQSAPLAAMEDVLSGCMAKLRADDQRLLALRYQEEVSPKTLAARFGRPLKTIYSSLNRIRRDLTECVRRGLGREEHS